MKDHEEASAILNIKITRSNKIIVLDQSHYIENILKKYNYFDPKHSCISHDPSLKLYKNICDAKRWSKYVNMICSLRYSINCIRHDIVYVVWLWCRFTSKPSIYHQHAVERVIRYLKRTMSLKLCHQSYLVVLEGCNDGD